jgi:ribosome biogenesis protein ENP2
MIFVNKRQDKASNTATTTTTTTTMNVQKRNDVSIYCLSSGPTLPEWLGDRARRNLSKKDEQIRRRIELLQEFQMPASSSKICQSSDGRYIVAAGTYPPRIRCYDVQDLSMKFERYTNANVLDMVLLREDYGKIALLLDDRTISFHAHYGNHETIRIPSFGRGMAYEPTTCELLVPAKGGQVYRVNLEEGRFHEPWSVEEVSSSSSSSISPTCIAVNQAYPVATVGCDDGTVRLWDNRSPDSLLRPMLTLDVDSATVGFGYYDSNSHTTSMTGHSPREITCIAHDNSGMHMAVGTGGGLVGTWLRSLARCLFVQMTVSKTR